MRAAVFIATGQPLVVETVTDPVPDPDQVILDVAYAGICGSDLHMTENPNMTPGIILGHEFAGTIAEIGSNVSGSWRIGDRVTALPLNACCHCDACDADLPALCPDNLFTGTTLRIQGAYAQLVKARGSMLQRLPDGVGFEGGAMVEPLAVGHHIVSMARMPHNADVLILGGGPIGIAVALFARHAGARKVVVSERSPDRRSLARASGATHVIDPAAGDVGRAFAAIAGGCKPQVVFECVGLPGMLDEAIALVGVRGQIVVAGVILKQDSFLPIVALGKEVTIQYSQAYTERDFEAVIGAIAKGEVKPGPIHTSTVGLDELPAAFEALRGQPRECKVLIKPS
ncbi:(R,R)-butanediol dehydrogenase/meso-butanediol dehydrogenase/diacetyl reductase [Sphingobium sp. OAS761]|uniref:zinc-binding dehydrogenase n=1 Tax=Sphingobium sp. OAS761 TaxID=2817901 RepID=UPI0020A01570|nr:alcohol dehydrogenase catalytic domain-containing protein [Sphingobium sp. OAS761]MCP1471668.1 (R,R)-butanediol dehydrogenase/meso-butanediol dehydrogenase/diacetyl reductase [Sphingobium sp. OAS761]